MANIYCQISGSKRFVLFPPTDVGHLSFAPGASSSSLDVFAALDSTQARATHPFEATLSPGDVLFIPRFWPHAAAPTTSMSIAVNVFFKDLQRGYSTGRDVYGNRDLAAYEKGRQEVTKVVRAFASLPPDVRDFYIQRLADEMLNAALE
jgi:tRNA wybutosine-synthesizing protein 4